MNKIDISLVRLDSKEESHIRNVRNERVETTKHPIDIKPVKNTIKNSVNTVNNSDYNMDNFFKDSKCQRSVF